MKTRVDRTKLWLLPILICSLALAGLFVGAQPASAVTSNGCIQDVWKAAGNNQNLTCTAKDVRLAAVSNIDITAGGNCDGGRCKCFGGDVTFSALFTMPLTADTRYDLGLYIATDGGGADGALTGQCVSTIVTAANAPTTFKNLDASPDVCGDITGPLNTAFNPQIITATITVACTDLDEDGKLNLPWCMTWRQPGANEICTSEANAYPGSPSKCNCGSLNIDIDVENPSITVTKTVDTQPGQGNQDFIQEPGGPATYTVQVKNDNQFTNLVIDRICDDKFGKIAAETGKSCPSGSETVTLVNNTCGTAAQGAGTLPATLAPQATYTCSFTVDLAALNNGAGLNAGASHTNTVCAAGPNSVGGDRQTNPPSTFCDDVTVTIVDVLPQAAGCKQAVSVAKVCTDVNYEVFITNLDTAESLTLNSLTDDKFGDITSIHGEGNGAVIATNGCATGISILPGQSSPTCTFTGRICTNSPPLTHTNRITAVLTDNEGNSIQWPADANPQTTLTLSAVSGNGVTATAGAAFFKPTDVGNTITAGNGVATITGFTDSTHVVIGISSAFSSTNLASGTWRLFNQSQIDKATASVTVELPTVTVKSCE